MSEYGRLEPDLRPGNASRFRQICAIIYKNFLVQTRSRWRCCGGYGATCFDIFLPVAIFAVMNWARHLPETDTFPIVSSKYPLRDARWSNAHQENEGRLILLAPRNNETEAIAQLLGTALACTPPGQAASGTHFQPFSDNFGKSWRKGLPVECQDPAVCLVSDRCGPALQHDRFIWADDGQHVTSLVQAAPATFGAAIVFGPPSGGAGAPLNTFELRVNHTAMPSTLATFSDFAIGTVKMTQMPDSDWQAYFWTANLLHAVERCMMARWLHGDNATLPLDIEVNVKAFPWPSKHIFTGGTIAGLLFIFLLVFAFQVPASSMVKSIVQEKELRLREYMRVLGLQQAAYWGSWFTTHFCMLTVTAVLCAVVGRGAFPDSSAVVLMFFYWAAAAALISFSYFVAAFFSRTQLASLLSPLIYFLAMLPAFVAVSFQPAGGAVWFAACLLPPSALAMFAMTLVAWSSNGAGITWSTLGSAVATAHPHFSAASVIGMLLVDTVLYAVAMLLIDRWETSDGLAATIWQTAAKTLSRIMNPEELLTQVSSMPRGVNASIGALLRGTPLHASDSPTSSHSGGSVRCMPPGHVVIKTDALSRTFSSVRGTTVAVDTLDLEVYDRHVTALLGHNGAGKSTTIGMLTGMLPPTGGRAIVDGRDVERDLPRLRASLGVCPQYDMLWPLLTVREHLRIYAALRGIPRAEVPEAAYTAAAEVDLLDKMDVRSAELSGGQQRKLSVAIAFLGNPRIVFLDEPTSGMDPAAKRFTWDVITRHKRHRAVVLTTHSMEEADALSDQIVILAQGKRAAQGSPFDLKERYGIGYTLTVVCHDGVDGRPSADSSGRGPSAWHRIPKAAAAVCESRSEGPASEWLHGGGFETVGVHLQGSPRDSRVDSEQCVDTDSTQLSRAGAVSGTDLRPCPHRAGPVVPERAAHAGLMASTCSADGGFAHEGVSYQSQSICAWPGAGCPHSAAHAVQSAEDMAVELGVAPGPNRNGWSFGECMGQRSSLEPGTQAGMQEPFLALGSGRGCGRRGHAVAESADPGKGDGGGSDDLDRLADMATLIEDSARSPSRRGRPPRHPGSSPTSGSREPRTERQAQLSAFGQWPGETAAARVADVPRLPLQKVVPSGSSSSRGRRGTPDSSGSRTRSQRSDGSLPPRSGGSSDGASSGVPGRGSRSLRSNMLSFGMHTHGSLDLDGMLAAGEGAAAAAAAAAASGPAAPAGTRMRASPRGRARRIPSGPPTLSSSSLSPRLPTHHEDAPSEGPPLNTAHGRHGSWLITGSAGGVFGSGGLSPSSDGQSPTPNAGEMFPDEDVFMQSETYRRHIQDAAAVAPAHMLAAEGGVATLVRSHVPQASVLTRCADEVSFRLPRASVTEFPNLLRSLEGSKEDLGIRSYGLSVTTLEEVFLRIAAENSPAATSPTRSAARGRSFTTPRTDGTISQPTSEDPTPRAFLSSSAAEQPLLSGARRFSRVARAASALRSHALGPGRHLPAVADPFECPRRRGLLLWWCQARAVARKHVRVALREPWVVATQLAVPLLLVLAAVMLGKRQSSLRPEPPLPLDDMHVLDGYKGFIAGSPAARASPLYSNFTHALSHDFVPWNGTRLDPAVISVVTPKNGTVDRFIADHWNSSLHVYCGVFVESLKHAGYANSAPVATLIEPAELHAELPESSARAGAEASEIRELTQPGRIQDEVLAGSGFRYGQGGCTGGGDSDAAARAHGSDASEVVVKEDQFIEVTLMVNQTAKHALPFVLNQANSGLLRGLLAERAEDGAAGGGEGMYVTLQPFPKVATERRVVVSRTMKHVSLIMFTALGLSVLAASFIVVPVKERSSDSMHVQMVSGLNPLALWPSLLAVDMLIFAVPGAIIVAFLSWSSPEAFSLQQLPLTASFMALFGLASISQMYAAHFYFLEEMNALLVASAVTSSTGIIGFFLFIVLDKLQQAEHSAVFTAVYFTLKAFLHLCSPTFLAMRLLYSVVTLGPGDNAWAWDAGGVTIAWLAIQAGVYLLALLVISSGVLCDVLHLVEQLAARAMPSKAQRLLDAPAARAPLRLSRGMSHAVGGHTSTSDGAFAASQHHLPATGIGSSVDLAECGFLSTHLSAGSNATGSGGANDSTQADGGTAGGGLGGLGGRRVSNGSSDRSGGMDLGGRSGSNSGAATSSAPSAQGSPETVLPPSINERAFQGWASFGGFGAAPPAGQPWQPAESAASGAAAVGGERSHGVLAAGVDEHSALVSAANPASYMVLLRNVSKVFGGGRCRSDATVAVKNVSLAIPAGHCFGLLGTNGAGKTTMFRMMTSDTRPTRGDVFLAGWRLNFSVPSSLARLATGYCPQSGGLTVALTALEILEFYARVRGLPSAAVPAAVEHVLAALSLEEHARVPVRALSGGNKRRLSVAAALIGAPQVLLLDEPSTGMDPTARRRLWAALQSARHAGHTIVLTSHAMADADVLCTRVGILVNGELRCVGSPTDLKACLNGGYVVEARLPRRSHGGFVAGLRDAFPAARLTVVEEPWSDIVVITVSEDALDVPRLYEVVEDLHAEFEGQSYAVSQASLEHVFMHVAHGDADDVAVDDAEVQGIDGDASRSSSGSTPAALDGGFQSFGDMGALMPEADPEHSLPTFDGGGDGNGSEGDFTFGSVPNARRW